MIVVSASHVTFRHLKRDVGDKISTAMVMAIAFVQCIFFSFISTESFETKWL